MKYSKTIRIIIFTVLVLLVSGYTQAQANISFFNPKDERFLSSELLTAIISANFKLQDYNQIKAQAFESNGQKYLLVFLFSKETHSVDLAKVYLTADSKVKSIIINNQLTRQDRLNIYQKKLVCPDSSIQFIAFAPHQNLIEQKKTQEVAEFAEANGLKTKSLLLEEATKKNFLNYLVCPKLQGVFYDGGSNTNFITTYDDIITSDEFAGLLKNKFNFRVVNIWLAGYAFLDPMKYTMIDLTQSQKYAAGLNILKIGPSDNAAACTIEAAIQGKAITKALAECRLQYDNDPKDDDQWGLEGLGSDFLGV